DHLAHEPDLDSHAFHLTDPRAVRVDELFNEFAAAAHAPRFAVSIDKRAASLVPRWPVSLALRVPPLRQVRDLAWNHLGIPAQVLEPFELKPSLAPDETQAALKGSAFEQPPPLHEYAPRLWDYWEREMDDLAKGHSMREELGGKHIIITGASSGIGRAAGLKLAAAGAVPLLVARNVDKLEEVRAEIVAAGGTAYVYAADLSDMESIERLLERVLADHRSVDGLVNNAGRSIRRSIALSYDRFHDFERTMQHNYFGAVKMIIGLLPQMRARG